MDAFSAVGLAVLGWALSELSHRFRANAQRRAALGRALVELLDIHHTAKTMALFFIQIRTQYGIPSADMVQVFDALDKIMPQDPKLSERYNTAVSEIAATHPVLAFRLKGREHLPRVLATIRSISSPEEFVVANELLNPLEIETLEGIILSVARAHSLSSWWQTRRRVKRKAEVPKQLDAFLEEAKKKLSEVEGRQAAGAS